MIDTAAQSYHYTPQFGPYAHTEINGWNALFQTDIDARINYRNDFMDAAKQRGLNDVEAEKRYQDIEYFNRVMDGTK